jgi:diguanylate cyclase (GGDEF)-like protein
MSESPRVKPIRVLLVEENPPDARAIREQLANAGANRFLLHHVDRLSAALRDLRTGEFDVVLMDLSVSHVYGLETIHRIEHVAPKVAIIVLSEHDDEAFALQAVQVGAQDYLVKGHGDGNLMARAIRYAIERKREKFRLTRLAWYDTLTGLANRVLFRDILGKALARSQRNGLQVGLLFLDLDNFKVINDTLGHDVGDQLLKTVADRLTKRVREGDTIARLGGDEFTVILEGLSRPEDVDQVARGINKAVASPFSLNGRELYVTTSIGIAMHPEGGGDPDTLIKNADTAMYHAKEHGRNNYQYYSPRMSIQAARRMEMENRLRHALDRQELVVHYQPLVDLRTGHIMAVEALLRWQRDGSAELLYPGDFLPVAEESGLIVPIGEWLFYAVCTQQRRWREAGLPPLRAMVNMSPRQFQKRGLVRVIERYLNHAGVSPGDLELELSESLLMNENQTVRTVLNDLNAMGLRMALDDFGTGYSSLRFLRHFPLQTLKIAQSFVRNIGVDHNDFAIATAIITLGHGLRLKVVAEGVETRGQYEFFQHAGADAFQGFIFSGAVPAEEIERLFREQLNKANTHTRG